MGHFIAGTQYDDWEGTVAADRVDVTSGQTTLDDYIESKGLIQANELLVSISFYSIEGSIFCSAYFLDKNDFDSAKSAIASAIGPLPVREVKMHISVEEFFDLFKRFNIVLTRKGLDLENREYEIAES